MAPGVSPSSLSARTRASIPDTQLSSISSSSTRPRINPSPSSRDGRLAQQKTLISSETWTCGSPWSTTSGARAAGRSKNRRRVDAAGEVCSVWISSIDFASFRVVAQFFDCGRASIARVAERLRRFCPACRTSAHPMSPHGPRRERPRSRSRRHGPRAGHSLTGICFLRWSRPRRLSVRRLRSAILWWQGQ
jgi:hypothetical protein